MESNYVSSSWAWQGIQEGKHLIKSGYSWIIGLEQSIRVTKDPWLPKCQGFVPKLKQGVIGVNDMGVSKLMMDSRRLWNKPLICDLFTNYEAHQIYRLQISKRHNDYIVWAFNCLGKFSTKSAYKSLTSNQNQQENRSQSSLGSITIM